MKEKRNSKQPYKFFLPVSLYKKTIRAFVDTTSSKIRIYRAFLMFMDSSLLNQNKELISRLVSIKKFKTLTAEDISKFKEIVRMYNPRSHNDLDLDKMIVLKTRIRRLINELPEKPRISKEAWIGLSRLLYEVVNSLGLLIEKYIIKSNRKTLSLVDVPFLFTNSTDFLL